MSDKPASDKLIKQMYQAQRDNDELECFIVTPDELADLRRECHAHCAESRAPRGSTGFWFMGKKVLVRDE